MIPFQLTILGTNAAMPAYGRMTSQQVLQIGESRFMIDCGEAAQIRLSQYKIKRNKIKAIFISHMHGDHIFGLPGLLTSYNHYSRTDDLLIVGPKGIKTFVEQVIISSQSHLPFKINYKELVEHNAQKVFEDQNARVTAFPLKHRITTFGYRFDEKDTEINIDKQAIKMHGLTVPQILEAKSGKDIILASGQRLSNADITLARTLPRSYAYCSDTIFDPEIVDYIKSVDLLYHETTYLDDMEKEAAERMHATASQAARIAQLAEVGQLVTGHYSGRFKTVNGFLKEAKKLFENTILGYDGVIVQIGQNKSK